MKLIILLTVCIIAANAVPAEDESNNDNNLSNLLKEAAAVNTRAENDNSVTYHLYTRSNPKSAQILRNNQNSIQSSNFDAKNQNVIIIHDWNSNFRDRLNTGLTEALLQEDNYNVISVNWGAASSSYASAKDDVDNVAESIANQIDFINNNFGPIGFLQLVGHGLGAHIAGSVGHQVQSGQLGKIVGLDPSRPTYNYNNINRRLSPDDAIYVESIQTNGGTWGWDRPTGKATFFPNGGRRQPSCSGENVDWCSHWRAVDYYIESISKNNFITHTCNTSHDAHVGTCESAFNNVRLGGPTNYSRGISGNFTVPVHADSPYGTGKNYL